MPIKKPHNKTRPLTRKQQAFVDHLINNPKASATEAAAQSYDVDNRNVARVIAAENLAKPAIISKLHEANTIVEQVLHNTVIEYGNSDKLGQRILAVDTAKYIHDKLHGRAKQSIETTSTGVTLHIDLVSSLTEVGGPPKE